MENTELIKVLRCELYGDDECDKSDCPIWSELGCRNGIGNRAAADSLEAAEKRIDGLQKLVDINTERCEALRKQLREAHENYEKHLNELEAQKPKRGEWIEKWRFKTDGTPFHKIGDMECSVCHGDMLGRFYSKYCPHCGARMDGAE